MTKLISLPIVLVLTLAIGACGSSSPTSSKSTPPAAATASNTSSTSSASSTTSSETGTGGPKISAATISGLGAVLVNAQGRTLYTFVPDKAKKVTCVSTCAALWPPAFVPAGKKPSATGLVKQSLLGSDPDPAGGQVITYAGWPLYTYVSDTSAGIANGQALNLNGGLWYVIAPSGKVITKKP